MCISKSLLRLGLISGLALGGATVLLGPQRVMTGLTQVRSSVQDAVGACIDDPIALRHQLQQLSDEYPERIAEIESEVGAVEAQLAAIHEDNEVAYYGVAITTDDLKELQTLIARAEEARDAKGMKASIRTSGGLRLDLTEAYDEARRINKAREDYKDRYEINKQQISFLEEQQVRLVEIRNKLVDESTDLETKLWQLDRDIDAIERNERLIEMTKQHERVLKGYDKFGEVHSVKQLQSKLDELKRKQRVQLEALTRKSERMNYEERAREAAAASDNPFNEIVIELDDNEFGEAFEEIEADEPDESDEIAWADPARN